MSAAQIRVGYREKHGACIGHKKAHYCQCTERDNMCQAHTEAVHGEGRKDYIFASGAARRASLHPPIHPCTLHLLSPPPPRVHSLLPPPSHPPLVHPLLPSSPYFHPCSPSPSPLTLSPSICFCLRPCSFTMTNPHVAARDSANTCACDNHYISTYYAATTVEPPEPPAPPCPPQMPELLLQTDTYCHNPYKW